MKKIVGVSLCLCMLIGVVSGCGNNNNVVDKSGESIASEVDGIENSQSEDSSDTQISSGTETTIIDSSIEMESEVPTESEKIELDEPTESQGAEKEQYTYKDMSMTMYVKESANVRNLPSSDGAKIGELEKGEVVNVTGKCVETNWYRIIYNNAVGYVSNKHLTEKKPQEQTPESQQPETQQPETQQPEPHEPELNGAEYNLSIQSYDDAFQVSEKYYMVKQGNYRGIVDFNGNVIVPIEYEKTYAEVGTDEVQFYKGNEAYVYNVKTGKLVLKYLKKEETEREVYKEYEENGKKITIASFAYDAYYNGGWDYETEEWVPGEEIYYVHRTYHNGILCEKSYVTTYINEKDLYGFAVVYCRLVYTNILTNKVVFAGFTTGMELDTDMGCTYEFSKDRNESRAVVVEKDILGDDKIYLTIIGPNGFVRKELPYIIDYDFGDARYDNGWLILILGSEMINVDTLEKIELSFDSQTAQWWYYGHGTSYAVSDDDEDRKYDIYNKDKLVKADCKDISYFAEGYIAYRQNSSDYTIMNYNGKDILTVKDYTDFLNGEAFIYDGEGVYRVDESFNKIGDYIYKGNIDGCRTGAICIDGKYYLVGKQ